eukprot:1183590-Prorocentrum_minimum.AAC.1
MLLNVVLAPRPPALRGRGKSLDLSRRGRPVLPAAPQRGASCLVDHPYRGPLPSRWRKADLLEAADGAVPRPVLLPPLLRRAQALAAHVRGHRAQVAHLLVGLHTHIEPFNKPLHHRRLQFSSRICTDTEKVPAPSVVR